MCEELNEDGGFQAGFHGTLGFQEAAVVGAGQEEKRTEADGRAVTPGSATPPGSLLSTKFSLKIAFKQRVLLFTKERIYKTLA